MPVMVRSIEKGCKAEPCYRTIARLRDEKRDGGAVAIVEIKEVRRPEVEAILGTRAIPALLARKLA